MSASFSSARLRLVTRAQGRRPGQGGRVPVLHHDALGAEGQGRTEDGADVLGVGQLIQHDDHALGVFGDLFQRHAFQRLNLEDHALMNGAGGQHSGQGGRIDHLDSVAVRQIFPFDFSGSVLRDHQTARSAADRIGQSGQNRMAAPDKIIRIGLSARGFGGGICSGTTCRRSRSTLLRAVFSALVERLFFTGFPVVAF